MSNDPFEFFMNKNLSDIVTVVVDYSTQKTEFMSQVGKKNSIYFNQKKPASNRKLKTQRPSRFVKGDKLDVV